MYFNYFDEECLNLIYFYFLLVNVKHDYLHNNVRGHIILLRGKCSII